MDEGDLIYFIYDEDMDLIDIELSEDAARASTWPGCTIEAHKYDPFEPRLTITIGEDSYQTILTTRKVLARERWVREVAAGRTDRGFEEWLADGGA